MDKSEKSRAEFPTIAESFSVEVRVQWRPRLRAGSRVSEQKARESRKRDAFSITRTRLSRCLEQAWGSPYSTHALNPLLFFIFPKNSWNRNVAAWRPREPGHVIRDEGNVSADTLGFDTWWLALEMLNRVQARANSTPLTIADQVTDSKWIEFNTAMAVTSAVARLWITSVFLQKSWKNFNVNPRTYTQSHTSTAVQEGLMDPPPLGILYVVIFPNDFAFSGKTLIFSTRWGIFYGWWRSWRSMKSPNMVTILDFIKNWKTGIKSENK